MKFRDLLRFGRRLTGCAVVLSASLAYGSVFAGTFPDSTQAKIDDALAKLSHWAGDTSLVDVVKSANAEPSGSMNNGKWVELSADAPDVTAITSSALSKQLGEWKNSKGLNKLFLRAKNGTLVAGAKKPLVYNVSKRPPFKNAIAGKVWHAGKAKPDPTTQIKSVQIAVPVKDGDEIIGVLHSSVIVP
jgi:hypothetical protein